MQASTVEINQTYSPSTGSIVLDNDFNEYVHKSSFDLGSVHYLLFDKPSLVTRKNIVKLQGFKNLEDDWDSYGAAPPSEKAIKNAKDFLLAIERKNLHVYFVAPGRNGEVLVEFKGDHGKAAEIYFNHDGSAEMLLFDKDDCIFEGEFSETKLIPHLI